MDTGLAIKDVEFNGAILRAFQDLEEIIWVGLKWVCEGLGLSEDRTKYERKKIKEDLVLSQGGQNFALPHKWGTTGGPMSSIRLSTAMACKDIHYPSHEKRKS